MKALFVILSCLVIGAFVIFCPVAKADNWVRPLEIEAGMVRGFQLKQSCEQGGHKCQDIGPIDIKDAMIEEVGGEKVISEDKDKAKESKDKDDDKVAKGQAAKAARVRLAEFRDSKKALTKGEMDEALNLLILLQSKR